MRFGERFLAWWGIKTRGPSSSELRLMRQFAEDVSVFFEQIGIEGQVAIRKLPSSGRQQNLAVDLFELEWRFQQELPWGQSLVWSSPHHPGSEVSAEYISHYFEPQSDDEIGRLATVTVDPRRPTKLTDITAYLRGNLPSILAALAGDGILAVEQQQQAFNRRIFDELGRHLAHP